MSDIDIDDFEVERECLDEDVRAAEAAYERDEQERGEAREEN